MRHLNKCGTDSFAKSNSAEGRAVFKPLWICFFYFWLLFKFIPKSEKSKNKPFFCFVFMYSS